MASMRAQNFDVNDDNEPAPENIPTPGDQHVPTDIYEGWGSNRVDHRCAAGHRFERVKLIGTHGMTPVCRCS